jgi:CMP-N,N'-diacetyllegionaminic acid synthase
MINGKSILAIIPARGGSKGIPRKNIRDLCGKPLIAWTIEEAKKSKYIDRLILSSEDDEIIAVAKKWGCEVPFVRPKALAQDDTPGIAPVLHAIDTLTDKYDYTVLLQVTSPLRTIADIDGCIECCLQQEAKSCVSVSEASENPYWMFSIEDDRKLKKLIATDKKYIRRQDLPKAYILNGAMYIAETSWLEETKDFNSLETIGYILPMKRSVDIDREEDFLYVTSLLKQV